MYFSTYYGLNKKSLNKTTVWLILIGKNTNKILKNCIIYNIHIYIYLYLYIHIFFVRWQNWITRTVPIAQPKVQYQQYLLTSKCPLTCNRLAWTHNAVITLSEKSNRKWHLCTTNLELHPLHQVFCTGDTSLTASRASSPNQLLPWIQTLLQSQPES